MDQHRINARNAERHRDAVYADATGQNDLDGDPCRYCGEPTPYDDSLCPSCRYEDRQDYEYEKWKARRKGEE